MGFMSRINTTSNAMADNIFLRPLLQGSRIVGKAHGLNDGTLGTFFRKVSLITLGILYYIPVLGSIIYIASRLLMNRQELAEHDASLRIFDYKIDFNAKHKTGAYLYDPEYYKSLSNRRFNNVCSEIDATEGGMFNSVMDRDGIFSVILRSDNIPLIKYVSCNRDISPIRYSLLSISNEEHRFKIIKSLLKNDFPLIGGLFSTPLDLALEGSAGPRVIALFAELGDTVTGFNMKNRILASEESKKVSVGEVVNNLWMVYRELFMSLPHIGLPKDVITEIKSHFKEIMAPRLLEPSQIEK